MVVINSLDVQRHNESVYSVSTGQTDDMLETPTDLADELSEAMETPDVSPISRAPGFPTDMASNIFGGKLASNKDGDAPSAPSMADNSNELTTVLIVVGSLAVVCVIVTVVILLCVLRIRRRRNKKKELIAAKYDKIFTTLRRPSPIGVTSTRLQLTDTSAFHANYNSFEMVNERAKPTKTLRKVHSGSDKLFKGYSVDSTSSGLNSPSKKTLKKSKSIPVLTRSASEPEFGCKISFSLKFDTKSRQLHMKLLSISNLPVKYYGYDVSAVVYLFPRNVDGVHSRAAAGEKDIQLNEAFLFDDMTLAEVEKSTLRVVLQCKRKMRAGKGYFLGEKYVKFCDFDWTTNQPLVFTSLSLGSRDKEGTPEKYLLEDLGSLFVCLEYQTVANRMKVMVRKANNLPKSDKLIGEPGHYVEIYLLRNGEVVKVQETKTQTGYAPIWNQPFLFDLKERAESHYSIDFVLMRKKLHTRDAVVGHVKIGENGCRSGRNHWKEIMSPRPVETAKWHSISPVFLLKAGHN